MHNNVVVPSQFNNRFSALMAVLSRRVGEEFQLHCKPMKHGIASIPVDRWTIMGDVSLRTMQMIIAIANDLIVVAGTQKIDDMYSDFLYRYVPPFKRYAGGL